MADAFLRSARGPAEPPGGEALGSAAVGAEPPEMSVAVASYNRRDRLPQVLDALARQDYAAERIEVIVVLDGSTDGSADVVRSFTAPYRLRVVEQPHRGLATTRNTGAREAAGDVVVFLDDDILPEAGFLAAHAAAHAAPGDCVVLGYTPPAPRDGGLWVGELRESWDRYFSSKVEPAHQWTFVDMSDGNSSFRPPVLFAHGGFDEAFAERRQDWELGFRLLRAGVRLVHRHDAVAWHHFEPNLANGLRNIRTEARNDVQLIGKHPSLKHHLPIAAFARGGGDQSTLRDVLYRNAGLIERSLRAFVPVAHALEAARARSAWSELVRILRARAYVLGLADALSLDEFRELAAAIATGEGLEQLVVELDGSTPLRFPPDAAAEVSVTVAGATLARLKPVPPGVQWNWDEVAERVALAVREGAPGELRDNPERLAALLAN